MLYVLDIYLYFQQLHYLNKLNIAQTLEIIRNLTWNSVLAKSIKWAFIYLILNRISGLWLKLGWGWILTQWPSSKAVLVTGTLNKSNSDFAHSIES